MRKPSQTKQKAYGSIIVTLVLLVMLAITTYALFTSMVSVEENQFEMGEVKIELNDGKTIFDSVDLNIEPGYSVKEDFTVENQGTADVYYRLYLENVTGALYDALTFEIYDGETLLYSGDAQALTKENPCISQTALTAGETKTLTAVVKMKEGAGNAYQTGKINFDVTVDAVQAKNNPDKVFE